MTDYSGNSRFAPRQNLAGRESGGTHPEVPDSRPVDIQRGVNRGESVGNTPIRAPYGEDRHTSGPYTDPYTEDRHTRHRSRRIRLTILDTLITATLGPRGHPLRAVLSGLGVAIGIASLVAVLGIPACFQAEAQAEFDAWGANLVIARPAVDRYTNVETPIPETAPAMVSRIWSVKSSFAVRAVPDAHAYRTDTIPQGQSQGISVMVGQGDPLGTLSTTMTSGRWFDDASSPLPTVVLGSNAATLLDVGLGQRVWIGDNWWAVIGILGPLPGFAAQLNSSTFLAPGWA